MYLGNPVQYTVAADLVELEHIAVIWGRKRVCLGRTELFVRLDLVA